MAMLEIQIAIPWEDFQKEAEHIRGRPLNDEELKSILTSIELDLTAKLQDIVCRRTAEKVMGLRAVLLSGMFGSLRAARDDDRVDELLREYMNAEKEESDAHDGR